MLLERYPIQLGNGRPDKPALPALLGFVAIHEDRGINHVDPSAEGQRSAMRGALSRASFIVAVAAYA